MPRKIKFIAYAGNGLLVGLFTLGALSLLYKGKLGGFLFCALVVALGVYNLYTTWKAAFLLSEEQWLESELRKAEIREKLKTMGRAASPPRSPQQQPPADKDPDRI